MAMFQEFGNGVFLLLLAGLIIVAIAYSANFPASANPGGHPTPSASASPVPSPSASASPTATVTPSPGACGGKQGTTEACEAPSRPYYCVGSPTVLQDPADWASACGGVPFASQLGSSSAFSTRVANYSDRFRQLGVECSGVRRCTETGGQGACVAQFTCDNSPYASFCCPGGSRCVNYSSIAYGSQATSKSCVCDILGVADFNATVLLAAGVGGGAYDNDLSAGMVPVYDCGNGTAKRCSVPPRLCVKTDDSAWALGSRREACPAYPDEEVALQSGTARRRVTVNFPCYSRNSVTNDWNCVVPSARAALSGIAFDMNANPSLGHWFNKSSSVAVTAFLQAPLLQQFAYSVSADESKWNGSATQFYCLFNPFWSQSQVFSFRDAWSCHFGGLAPLSGGDSSIVVSPKPVSGKLVPSYYAGSAVVDAGFQPGGPNAVFDIEFRPYVLSAGTRDCNGIDTDYVPPAR